MYDKKLVTKLIDLLGDKKDEGEKLINQIIESCTKPTVEPMEFFVPQKDVSDSLQEDYYKIIKYKGGIEYNVCNSFRLFVSDKNLSVYGLLNTLLMIQKGEIVPSNKKEEEYYQSFVIITHKVLQSIILAASDNKLLLDMFEVISKYLIDLQEKMQNQELKEDDNPKLTQAMMQAIPAAEHLADTIKDAGESFNQEK